MIETTSLAEVQERLSEAHRAYRRLILFFATERPPVVEAMGDLLEAFSTNGIADSEAALGAYQRFFCVLAEEIELRERHLAGDAWRTLLLEALLADENTFSRKAALSPSGEVSPALRAAAEQDLRHLQVLYRLESSLFRAARARRERWSASEQAASPLVAWEDLRPLAEVPPGNPEEAELLRQFATAGDWGALVGDLALHYARSGSGLFRRYRAFRWVSDATGGHLEGIAHPDPISLEDLIGCEEECRVLLRNTEQFLAGSPANNVLLYGDRGTGKSSMVKALLNAYAERGLRLLEVQKQHLSAFPRILKLLRGRRERFILFVDDLSFEENETNYKDLKAVLEGGLETRPENVLLYATSNRRHLIRERFSDRDHVDPEIHARDTSQEKLSLSDRFGITITFLSPDQEGYLAIVEGLAKRLGLEWPAETLRRRALQWAARYNGWSGRSARQFIHFALGEQALEAAAHR